MPLFDVTHTIYVSNYQHFIEEGDEIVEEIKYDVEEALQRYKRVVLDFSDIHLIDSSCVYEIIYNNLIKSITERDTGIFKVTRYDHGDEEFEQTIHYLELEIRHLLDNPVIKLRDKDL